jgi:Zn-dependent peptidase ImmA (M78 family)
MSVKHRTRQQIEQMVRDLLLDHNAESVPIPVERIAREKGLPVVEATMEADVSGALVRTNDLQGIAVNASQAPVRKRFTIAHELGHFLLDHVGRDQVDWQFTVIRRDGRSSEADDDQEIAANFFAANLLMPRHILRRDVEQFKGFDGEVHLSDSEVLTLARRYKVNGDAMRFRLQGLGFLPLV